MATTTDAALDLAELCEQLRAYADSRAGEEVLAEHFRVDRWSADFFQTLFAVNQRFDQLSTLVSELEIAPVLKAEAESHIQTMKRAFSRDAIINQWSYAKNNLLSPATVGPIKFLSPLLQQKYPYPKLDDAEIAALLSEVDQLNSWLVEHQLKEEDFFRAAIIEGLFSFRFRLERLRCLGWGYSLKSLRDVIQAYLALNGIIIDRNDRPEAGGLLMKVSGSVGRICRAAHLMKEAGDTAEFMVKAYEKVSEITQDSESIRGLIESITKGGSS